MELLVCPVCKGALQIDPATRQLVCKLDRLGFVVRDGIAVMLEAEAVPRGERGEAPPAPPEATPTP